MVLSFQKTGGADMKNSEEVLRRALDECLAEAEMSAEEMRAFIFRLATRRLNERDIRLIAKRNKKASRVIH